MKVDADKTLKIPTADILHPRNRRLTCWFIIYRHSQRGSPFDLGDSTGNQAVKCGIAPDGKLFIEDKEANIAYGANKSELIGWDNIAIQWKTERLSLIINGAESAYIENPGQVGTFATYAFIGSDKAGANQIGTTIDELRIDSVYQSIEKVSAWHIVDAPFYTSEEFKQWPGYLKAETDGLKVYDSENALRVLVGSWVRDEIRKYGIKIIGGEFYAGTSRLRKRTQLIIMSNRPNK